MWQDGTMISAGSFSEELKKIPATVNTLTIRINSPGGDVFDGITIYNRLKQFKAKKKVCIDGLAASIASIIAMAGDEIIMGEGALFMVHLPWTMTMGNRMEMDNTINRLMDVEEQMLGIYSKKTGLPRHEIRALLEAETWMNSDTAINFGFVDSKSEDTIAIAASAMKSKWITKRPESFFSDREAAQEKLVSEWISDVTLK
jgi:ATP-dependent protease ClpP protease subunit